MCMDTWFGDVNMVTDIGDNGAFLDWNPSPRTWLHRDPAGHPRIFNRFCANLMTKGLLDYVLPFRSVGTSWGNTGLLENVLPFRSGEWA